MILNILLGIHAAFGLFGLINYIYYSVTVGPIFEMHQFAKFGFASLLVLAYRLGG